MKILYVITGLGLGGAEKVVVQLAEQMYLNGHDVKIAYLKGDISVKPDFPNIELIYLGLDKFSNLFTASNNYKKLIINFQPDIIHSHMVHANIFSRINNISNRVPKLICTAHSSNEGGRIRMLAYKFTNFLSDINTNVSERATNSFIKNGAFNKNNLLTVYNGIDVKKFRKNEKNIIRKNEVTTFISIGRLNKHKDYPNLLKAISIIKNQIKSNIKFYIIGDGELRNFIENLIHDLEINEFVHLLGKRDDIPNLLNQADFLILSSKNEGLPTVLIEAMACETFVIATDCGGSSEIMGNTGKLIPISDPAILANTILEVLDLSQSEISYNNSIARNRVEQLFSLQKSIDTWLELYEN